MKKLITFLGCALLILGLIIMACAPAKPLAPTEKVLKIGYVGAMTGPLAYLDVPMHQGCDVAVDMCNAAGGLTIGGQKYKVEMLHFDDRGETQSAISGATQLIEQGAQAIFTCFSTQVPLQAVTEPKKVILITCGGADAVIRPDIKYTFAFEGPSNTIKPWGDFYTTILNVKKMAVLTENQEFSVDRHDVFVPEWKKRGTEIVFDEMFEPSTADFHTILSKIKATNPDALFLDAYSSNALAVFKQRLEIGYPVQVFTFNQLTCIGPEAWRLVGKAGEGLIEEIWHYPMGMPPQPGVTELFGFDPDLRVQFMAEVAKRYGAENLSANHGLSHDMVFEYLKTVEYANSLDPDAIVTAYENKPHVKGVLFECFHWKDSHRILVPRGLGRYYNIDPVKGTADLQFLQVARFLNATGTETEMHEIAKYDVRAERTKLGY